MKQPDFYDLFHKKNSFYDQIMSDNNFTYFYTLQFLQEHDVGRFAHQLILDVGCGVGTLALYLAKKGARVVGVNISPQAIVIANHARDVNHLTEAAFISGELQPGEPTFDGAVCTEVIEHIRNDAQFLRTIHSHLKNQAFLYLTTPSRDNWLFRHGYYRQFDQQVGHLRRYTAASITQLLTDNGFEVLSLKSVEGPLRNMLFTSRLGFLIRFIKGPLVPIFHWFDDWSAQIWGASDLLIWARKKKL